MTMRITARPVSALLLAAFLAASITGAATADGRTRGSWAALGGSARSAFSSSVTATDKDGTFTFRISSEAQSLELRTDDRGRLLFSYQTVANRRLAESLGFDAKRISAAPNGMLRCELYRGGKKTKTMMLYYGSGDLVTESLQFSLNGRLKAYLRDHPGDDGYAFKTNLVLPSMGLRVPVKVSLLRSDKWPGDMFSKVAMKAPAVPSEYWLFTIRVTGFASIFARSSIYVAYRADKRDELIALVYASAKNGEGYISE